MPENDDPAKKPPGRPFGTYTLDEPKDCPVSFRVTPSAKLWIDSLGRGGLVNLIEELARGFKHVHTYDLAENEVYFLIDRVRELIIESLEVGIADDDSSNIFRQELFNKLINAREEFLKQKAQTQSTDRPYSAPPA